MFLRWAKHPVLRDFIPPKANERRESPFPTEGLMTAERVFGMHGCGKDFSTASEPILPENHAELDEDVLEVMAMWCGAFR